MTEDSGAPLHPRTFGGLSSPGEGKSKQREETSKDRS